jgi:hypothetical protein
MIPNPKVKFAKSKGVDLPIMYVYLAGYMSGEKLEECTKWRKKIRDYYRKWEEEKIPVVNFCDGSLERFDSNGWSAYPIAFLDPFNGPELDTIDKKGLKSNVPSNAIIHGDYMSVCKADIVVANMNTFGATRPSTGTHWELAWTWQMKKPFVLITEDENYTKHPFTGQASWIVKDVEELLKEKVLETFYRRMAGAIYE